IGLRHEVRASRGAGPLRPSASQRALRLLRANTFIRLGSGTMLIPMMVLSRVGIIDFEERDIRWSRSESYTFARMRTIADSRNRSFRCKSSKAKATYWA